MRILIFGIKVVLDAYRDTKRIIKHFNLISLNGIIIVPKLFLIRLIYTLSFFRNLIKPNIKESISFDDYFEEKEIFSKNLTLSIDKDGCTNVYNLKKSLKKEIIDEIFLNKEIEYKNINKQNINNEILIKKENEELETYFDRLANNNVSRVTGFIDLKKESIIQSFITSKPLISLAKSYLNSNNFSINATYFISSPVNISREEKFANAQYFHWDNDFSKFLKLYIYLTDVDQNSGPHIFIPDTHKKKNLSSSLPRLYDDKIIYETYDKKKKYIGKSGSIFFTDGYGLHKGETPERNSRLILNVHYGKNKILYSNKDIFYKNAD